MRHFISIPGGLAHDHSGAVSRSALLVVLMITAFSAAYCQQDGLDAILQRQEIAFAPGGFTANSFTLSGVAEVGSGSTKRTANISFVLAPDGSVSETWSFNTTTVSIQKTPLSGERTCTGIAIAPTKSYSADCFRPVPWFAAWLAPQLSVRRLAKVLTSPGVPGAVTNSISLLLVSGINTVPAGSEQDQLDTATTISYAPETFLPTSLSYKAVVDGEPSHALDIFVTFEDYRLDGGYVMPHHIRRFVQRTLESDLRISSIISR